MLMRKLKMAMHSLLCDLPLYQQLWPSLQYHSDGPLTFATSFDMSMINTYMSNEVKPKIDPVIGIPTSLPHMKEFPIQPHMAFSHFPCTSTPSVAIRIVAFSVMNQKK